MNDDLLTNKSIKCHWKHNRMAGRERQRSLLLQLSRNKKNNEKR